MTEIEPEKVTKLAQLVRAGVAPAQAARAAGIAPDGLADLLVADDGIRTAAADFEARNVAVIAQAATEDWKAAAWLLERRHPERWARPSQREGLGDQPPVPEAGPFAEADELAARRRAGES